MYKSKNIVQAIKNRIWWTFIRRKRGAPENFFYFPSNRKWNHEIRGYHWSGQIRIFRMEGESHKAWTAFCFKLVYNSRNNKDKAGKC